MGVGYYQNELRDMRGNALTAAVVDVFDVGTTNPATIFSDAAGTVPMVASPLQAAAGLNRPGKDTAANIAFFADDSVEYDVRVTQAGTGYTFRAKMEPGPIPPGTLVQVAGDTMTGPLVLAGDAAAALEAVTKQQVDAGLAAKTSHAWTVESVEAAFDPIILPHRGAGDLIAPENTLEAIRVGAGMGFGNIDCGDLRLLPGYNTDFVLMHDDTVDRTSSSTGAVSGFDLAGWRLLTLDAGSWFGGGYGNMRPPTFIDVVREFSHAFVLWPELKTTGAASTDAFIDIIERHQLVETTMACTFNLADATALAAAGLHTCIWMSTAHTTPAALLAAGIEWVGLSSTLSDATFTDYISAGLKVMVWTIARQNLRDKYVALGCRGVASSDPLYTSGEPARYRRTTSPFKSGAFPPGLLVAVSGWNGDQQTDPAVRGTIVNGFHRLERTGPMSVLQGWACPLPDPTTYTIDLDISYLQLAGDTTQWAGVALGCPNDMPTPHGVSPTEISYSVILRQNGTLAVFTRNGSGSVVAGPSVATTAITVAGTTVHLKLAVTPTTVTATRTDTGNPAHTITLTDAQFRGAYFHVIKNEAAADPRIHISYGNVVIT